MLARDRTGWTLGGEGGGFQSEATLREGAHLVRPHFVVDLLDTDLSGSDIATL